MPFHRRPLLAAVALLLTSGALVVAAPAAQAFAPPGPRPTGAVARAQLDQHIVTALAARLSNPRLGRDVAIQVGGPGGTGVLFAQQPTAAQMPASNMKLVTALGALTSLGPDHGLTTRVVARSVGGLVLVGQGDPLLTSTDLDRLAVRTAATLTTSGSVRVFVSDYYFHDGTLAPGWRSSYVPGEVTYVRALGRHGVHLKDTAVDAGRYFVSRLAAHGVPAVYGGRAVGSGTTVAQTSHTVGQAVHVMLRDSDNQVAETLFRHVAIASGRAPTWAGGAAAALAVLKSHGITTTGMRLYDGSGLSRSDRLTPRALVQVLTLAGSGEVAALDDLADWLPVAGRSGTLAAKNGRFTTSPSRCAAGLVHAKTGTLTGALALSGYAYGEDGSRRPFSIIVNSPPTSTYSVLTVRRAIDGLAATLTGCW